MTEYKYQTAICGKKVLIGEEMKGILRYLKDYKKESVLAPLFKMLEATFELLIPIVMANVIDVGIAGRDIGYVVKM